MTKMVDLAALVSKGLGDPSNVSFDLEEDIYPWLAEADKTILNFRPDANTTSTVITTVAGSKQSIPEGHIRLIDVPCNIHPSSGAELRDVTLKPRGELSPGWRTIAQVDIVENYMFDDRNPTEFEVFPPVAVGRKLRVVTCVGFEDYGTISDSTESQLDQVYDPAKIEWALYRGFTRDNSPNRARGYDHLRNFYQLLGVKANRDLEASPKREHQDK
ncbi:MAG TPA: DUF6682 family protein [Pseudomonadales bacterium]